MSFGAQYLSNSLTIGAGQTLWFWFNMGGPAELTYVGPLPVAVPSNIHVLKTAIERRPNEGAFYWVQLFNPLSKTQTFQLGAYQFGVFPGNL